MVYSVNPNDPSAYRDPYSPLYAYDPIPKDVFTPPMWDNGPLYQALNSAVWDFEGAGGGSVLVTGVRVDKEVRNKKLLLAMLLIGGGIYALEKWK